MEEEACHICPLPAIYFWFAVSFVRRRFASGRFEFLRQHFFLDSVSCNLDAIHMYDWNIIRV